MAEEKLTWAPEKVEHWEQSKINEYSNNPRVHSDEQINQIIKSIKEFGFTNPILVGSSGTIIAGHGRFRAAKKLGMKKIPVIVIDHLSEAQKKALVIADNKIAQNAGWNEDLLMSEIESLNGLFDAEFLGFAEGEIYTSGDDEGAIEVREIQTSEVNDQFWIIVKGRLRDQADVLNELKKLLSHIDGVDITVGTTKGLDYEDV